MEFDKYFLWKQSKSFLIHGPADHLYSAQNCIANEIRKLHYDYDSDSDLDQKLDDFLDEQEDIGQNQALLLDQKIKRLRPIRQEIESFWEWHKLKKELDGDLDLDDITYRNFWDDE